MTACRWILDTLADGRPRSDWELHDEARERGHDYTYKCIAHARRRLLRRGALEPVAGFAHAPACGGEVQRRHGLVIESAVAA